MSAVSPRIDFDDAFPASTKVHVTAECAGERLSVPMREIALSGGEPPLQVYDTSGPQACNVREGLPPIRAEWIARRGQVVGTPSTYRPVPGGVAAPEIPPSLRRPVFRGTGPVTQLHYARRGEVTPEMAFVAVREGLDPEFVRSEIARGRAILPANINHP
jgi:phosphomethylpyrimidine synthase